MKFSQLPVFEPRTLDVVVGGLSAADGKYTVVRFDKLTLDDIHRDSRMAFHTDGIPKDARVVYVQEDIRYLLVYIASAAYPVFHGDYPPPICTAISSALWNEVKCAWDKLKNSKG